MCWIGLWTSSKADKKVRRLTTQDQFIALLYAQLAGSESLRAIEAGFESHASKLYHLGACEVSRSTLADANAQRPCAVFTGLLAELMGRCERPLGRKMAEAVYLVDATGFRLNALSADWAQFSAGVSGAKLHIVYNPDSARPNFAEVTPANVNDITVAKTISRWRKAWARFGLVFSSLYLMYCIVNKFKIDNQARYALVHQSIHYNRYFTTPTALNNWLWYIVAETDSRYITGYRSVFDQNDHIQISFFFAECCFA